MTGPTTAAAGRALRLLLVCGSTRPGSSNALALAALHDLDEPGVATDLFDGLRQLPAFVAYEDSLPGPVVDLLDRIAAADAVVFATPEYAGGLPGALKNLLDWTVGGGQLYGKPVAWIDVANPGRGGGARSQLRTVLGYVGARIVEHACVHVDVVRRDGAPQLEPSHSLTLRVAVAALRGAITESPVLPTVGTAEHREWPDHLVPGAVRWAWTSRHYERCVSFYRDLVGLPVLEQFTGSYGEDGTLFGLPGAGVHLEITRANPGPEAAPAHDGMRPGDQLVFYLPGPVALAAATRRLREAGLAPDDAPPAYWAANRAVIFRDPDGHGVVYAPWVYARDTEPAERAAG